MRKQSFQHDALMRIIKIVDIGYISILYIVVAIFAAKYADKMLGSFDEAKEAQKPFWKKTLNLFLLCWAYGVLIYVVRNVVKLVPFPLNGFRGFDHSKVKELGSWILFSMCFLTFNKYLKEMLGFYYKQV